MVKNDTKWSFGTFYGISSLDLAEGSVNQNCYCAVTFCKNYIYGKIQFPKLYAEMLSSNMIARFVNHQYLYKESINILGFLYGSSC